MKCFYPLNLITLVLIASVFSLSHPTFAEDADQQDLDGYQRIFNGSNLDNWEGDPQYWSVEDGSLTGVTDGSLKMNRFITWTPEKVRNFDLRVKVKVSAGGNSGIQYRGTARPDLGPDIVTGYQCDVVANTSKYNGMLYEERGRRILAHTGEKVIVDPAGQSWIVEKMPVKNFAADTWHDYRVLVRGNHHQHWIDGHKTADLIDLDEKNRSLEGVLAVQVHVGPKMKIQYRDFLLKPLPDDIPLLQADECPIPADATGVRPQGRLPKDWKPPVYGDQLSQTEFAENAIRVALSEGASSDTELRVRFTIDSSDKAIKPEGFRIQTNSDSDVQEVNIIADDSAGLLYGGLEVAEIIRTMGPEAIVDGVHNPYMAMRGTKFNIPLDVRTPSYSDLCDSAQKSIPEVWDFQFWKEYIDTLAHYRYNFVSLWSLHPFPSMVKVPEYPKVALDEVWRSKGPWKETYSLQGRGFVTEEILQDVEVINTMSIDEKIEFWKRVMAYGKSRNVDFYFVTWNVFTYGTNNQYGIDEDPNNETTKDYFRQSVKQMFLTYPDLAGIGLTTGENMRGMDFQAKEDWAMATYGQGVLDAAKLDPSRKITFIHRQHMAKADDISRTFEPVIEQPNVEFIFSFKYAKAHVYSATKQYMHHAFVKDLGDRKTIWTLRNDDIYYFRWAAPQFVREFIKNIPYEVSRGYYYGSDQWVWGREFLQLADDATDPEKPRQLEIQKHWMHWLLWGRLGYDPDFSNERLVHLVADRFELALPDASNLLEAWQDASMIYPTTTGFHWGPLDFQWYIEACQSQKSYAQNDTGFHDVNRFINLPPHPSSGNQSIPDFVSTQNDSTRLRTPMQVADQLDKFVSDAQEKLKTIPRKNENEELSRTLTDIQIICHLGSYYADKIRGATGLALFRASKDREAQQRSIAHLTEAAEHFGAYIDLASKHHRNPLWTNRVGYVNWKQTYEHVVDDIRIASEDGEVERN